MGTMKPALEGTKLDEFQIGNGPTLKNVSNDLEVATISIQGSLTLKRTAISANYTALMSDHIIGVDTTSAAITISLPAAATAGAGFTYKIKDETGNAATNNITINANVDGVASLVLNGDYDAATLYSNGSSWLLY